MKNVKKVMVSLLLCTILLFSGAISAFAVTTETQPLENTSAKKTQTVYFDNNRAGWDNVYAWYLNEYDQEDVIEVEMTKGENNIYSGEISIEDFAMLFFFDGESQMGIAGVVFEEDIDLLYIIEPCLSIEEAEMTVYMMSNIPLEGFSVEMKYTVMFEVLMDLAEIYLDDEYDDQEEYEALKKAYDDGKMLYDRLEDATQEEIDAHTLALVGAFGMTQEPEIFQMGDVNFDFVVDMQDVLMVQKHVAQLSVLDEEEQYFADVNGDGVVDMHDVLLLQKYIAKLIDIFPVEENMEDTPFNLPV